MRVYVARRGSSGARRSRIAIAIAGAEGPLIRTTPMPPRPGGVAMATMESLVANPATYHLPATTYWLFVEMMTVFMNASPMLSDVAEGSSAIAR